MYTARLLVLVAIAACGSDRGAAVRTQAPAAPATAAKPTPGGGQAAAPGAGPAPIRVRRLEHAIPMRDGIKLNTEIFIPDTTRGPQAILLDRTPYEAPSSDAMLASPRLQERPWVKRGTILVAQDIRGRFKSEGKFAMFRPSRDRSDPRAVDETTDAYDTIEWLVRNVPNNNGRVGMTGTSYDGWLVAMALIEPHPALVLAELEGTPADLFVGDDLFHNGALRRQPAFEYVALMESGEGAGVTPFVYPNGGKLPGDAYAFHLGLGPLSEIDRSFFHGKRPTWNDLAGHPTYDEFWQRRNATGRFTTPTVRTVHVAGWYDIEDFYGAVTNYLAFERHDRNRLNQLVIGPWRHGDWMRGSAKLGVFDYGTNPSDKYRELRALLAERHLYGQGAGDDTEAWLFETGSNRWRAFAQFPPPARAHKLYFGEAGALAAEPPRRDGADQYVSDPARPVPHTSRPQKPFWEFTARGLADDYGLWRIADQRFASDRPDVAQWVTAPLERDTTVAGAVTAHLFASTTGTDCDFIVRLIDVYPDTAGPLAGYQLMVSAGVLPARFREGLSRAVAAVPGKTYPIDVDLRWIDHQFAKGHRIMVTVQSSWFPLIERNPQTLVNPFVATAKDFRVATQRIVRSPRQPSHIELPVIDEVP